MRTDPAEPKVRYAVDQRVAHVVLNRPERRNALDSECLELLEDAIRRANADPEVRAIVLSAEGPVFCAGADLKEVDARLRQPLRFDAFLERWHEVFGVVERSDVPTIAAVNGAALAGGLELLQVCDVVVAARDARIGDQHATFGLFPGGGSTQRLPRLVGRRQAMWMLLSGDSVSAEDALAMGLVTRVVDQGEAHVEAVALARTLAARSPLASAAIKRAVRLGQHLPLEAALNLERGIAVAHMQTLDVAEGLRAFRDRRTPEFSGLRVEPDGDA